MEFKRYNSDEKLFLMDCPFCGGKPEVKHKGHGFTSTETIEIKCKKCRCKRVDATRGYGWGWLEDAAVRNWNQRPTAEE